MALSGAMGSGISGLKAFMNALNVVGNNVANVNTYGYKAGRVTFKESIYNTQSVGSEGSDLLGGTNPTQFGYGTSVGTIDLDMSTQGLESTGRTEDCAIVGDGFFLLGDKDGVDVTDLQTLSLSRVGDFKIDDSGYLTDGSGNIVYGFVTCSNAGTQPGTDPSEDVSLQLVPLRLPLADDTTGATLYPGVNNNENTYGQYANNDPISYTNLQIDTDGRITCTNGMTKEPVVVGYIALGTVTNPAGLTKTDGPYYQISDSAGDLSISTALSTVVGNVDGDANTPLLTGSTTKIMSGYMEQSGTDLATEFANMIVYQRGYQANTRIVTVTDTMLEELINMKR